MTDTPTHPIDKELVAKRFSYSRSTYDREASVQRQVAEKMMRLLTDALLSAGIPRPQLPTHFRHIVELGCGTGSYSRMLLNTLQPETLLLNDLCRDMEECVSFSIPASFLTKKLSLSYMCFLHTKLTTKLFFVGRTNIIHKKTASVNRL